MTARRSLRRSHRRLAVRRRRAEHRPGSSAVSSACRRGSPQRVDIEPSALRHRIRSSRSFGSDPARALCESAGARSVRDPPKTVLFSARSRNRRPAIRYGPRSRRRRRQNRRRDCAPRQQISSSSAPPKRFTVPHTHEGRIGSGLPVGMWPGPGGVDQRTLPPTVSPRPVPLALAAANFSRSSTSIFAISASASARRCLPSSAIAKLSSIVAIT